ncbi:MAG: copper resistance protein [Rhodopseudomonas sp.]|nr:copper resistance protein [Rhodopseudomonas sp.]
MGTYLKSVLLIATLINLPAAWAGAGPPGHHHETFSAGEPGDAEKPARTIKMTMLEDGKKMLFKPARIEVKRGEQIRFVLQNDGTENHEFVLASVKENKKHGLVMKKNPQMEHDDPNGKRLSPFSETELLWRFTKRGEFEFACLIPGHYEAGMHGVVIVK